MITEEAPIAVEKFKRDRERARKVTRSQARYLVDTYYQVQNVRIRAGQQVRTANEDEPTGTVSWLADQMGTLERTIQRELGDWAAGTAVGAWSQSITGIGPVLSAGLLAHIDITKAPTVGHIWRFAGLDPTLKWGKGEKRPYNASLKVLCWKIGDSFNKVKNHPKDIYGHVLDERKVYELKRDAAGGNAQTAAETLATKNIRDAATRKVYEAGFLPLGRLELRARRYAVKLFLAHWQYVAYEAAYGTPPPKPYIIEHGGHAHMKMPPNWPMA